MKLLQYLLKISIIMKSSRKKSHQLTTASFIQKLSKMLQNCQYQHIISWTEDETAIIIKNVSQLTEIVLPAYFKHRNLSSFIRQLNMYNFNKIRHAEGQNVYMNELFKKGNTKEYKNIKRRSVEQRQQIVAYDPGYANNTLTKELGQLNKKQKELEMVIKHLISDNQNLRNENAKLWKKIQKTMQKSDKKLEKLLLFMLFGKQNMIGNQSGNQSKPQFDSSYDSDGENSVDKSFNTRYVNQQFYSNICNLLEKKKGMAEINNFMKYFADEKPPNKKKKQEIYEQKQQSLQPVLYIKENGEIQEQMKEIDNEKQHSIISDVNLFLKSEGSIDLPHNHLIDQ